MMKIFEFFQVSINKANKEIPMIIFFGGHGGGGEGGGFIRFPTLVNVFG